MGFIYLYVLNFAWRVLDTSFSSVISHALYYKRLNRWGTLASLIIVSLFSIVWSVSVMSERVIYVLVPTFFLSLVFGIFFSLITGGKENV